MTESIHLRFSGSFAEGLELVEAERPDGTSIDAGEWGEDGDDWVLKLDPVSSNVHDLVERFNEKHDVSLDAQTMVLSEETGELSEAVLSHTGRKLFKENATLDDIGDEAADVIYTAWSVAAVAGVDDVAERVESLAERNLERETTDD